MIFTLHGWSFDRSVWNGTAFENCVHLELPGHGESPFKSTDLLELSQEAAEALPEGSTLVGWSLGATVSVLVGALYPKKIGKLILVAPTVRFSGISQPKTVVERFLKKLRRNFKKTVLEFRALCSKEKYPLPQLKPEFTTELLENFAKFDLSPYLSLIDVPVEIFVGQEDTITGLKGALSVFNGLKSVRLNVYPGKDHLTVLHSLSA